MCAQPAGGICQSPPDCSGGLACINGTCCQPNGGACTSGADCCGGSCVGGACGQPGGSDAGASGFTFSTNQSTYHPLDKVHGSGTAAPGAAVTFTVYNPGGSLVSINQTQADASGNYGMDIFTFPSAPNASFPYGTYTIRATTHSTTLTATVQFSP